MDNRNNKKNIEKKEKRYTVINFILSITLFVVLGYIGCIIYSFDDHYDILNDLISAITLLIFTILFIYGTVKINYKKKNIFLLSSTILMLFSGIQIINMLGIDLIPKRPYVKDFTNSSLTEVLKWANKNNINVNQEYEYSDMVKDYYIIGQNIKPNTLVKNIKDFTVSISEGPNPEKEVIIPNMVSWNSDAVLEFVIKNKLSNVSVEYITSEQAEDTLIEQSKTGSMKRNEELKLTFSLGETWNATEVKMIDLTNKEKIEAIFWLEKNKIKYELKEDFSNKITRGNVSKQSIEASNNISLENDTLTVTVSKGNKIIVPNLETMSLEEITDWVIENKLKIEIKERYDDSIKKNNIIEANYKKGDVIAQKTLISVVLSKGTLKMVDFSSLAEFKIWAEKYSITYEEQYEFSDDVKAGEIIRFSYSKGDVIKNGDRIIIKISQGKKVTVPDLTGLSKANAMKKLDDLNLKYTFIYKSSSTVSKDIVLAQSITKNSEVGSNSTITITLSSGKASSSSSSSSGGSNSSNETSCDKNDTVTVYLYPGNTGAQTKQMIQNAYGSIKWNFNMVSSCPNGSIASGSICNASDYDGKELNKCTTYTLTIVN